MTKPIDTLCNFTKRPIDLLTRLSYVVVNTLRLAYKDKPVSVVTHVNVVCCVSLGRAHGDTYGGSREFL